jgi:AraC-like DNA-binding protein
MTESQSILYTLLLLHSLLLTAYLIREGRLITLRFFLVVFALHMGLNLIEGWLDRDVTTMVAPVLAQLYGPSLLLFFTEIMYSDFRIQRAQVIHLLPAGLAVILMFTAGPGGWVDVVLSSTILLYLFVALHRVLKFHREVKDAYSDPWGARLDWMVMIILGFIVGASLDGISRSMVEVSSAAALGLQTLSLIVILGTLTAMVWKAMVHPKVLVEVTASRSRAADIDVIDVERMEAFKMNIDRLFIDDELHLKPRLTVGEVAEKMGLLPKDVSRFINLGFEQNFSDYVNGKRVDAAVALMRDQDHARRSLLQIAFDAGFSSKTAFHDSFNRKMQTTPSAWRKQNA